MVAVAVFIWQPNPPKPTPFSCGGIVVGGHVKHLPGVGLLPARGSQYAFGPHSSSQPPVDWPTPPERKEHVAGHESAGRK